MASETRPSIRDTYKATREKTREQRDQARAESQERAEVEAGAISRMAEALADLTGSRFRDMGGAVLTFNPADCIEYPGGKRFTVQRMTYTAKTSVRGPDGFFAPTIERWGGGEGTGHQPAWSNPEDAARDVARLLGEASADLSDKEAAGPPPDPETDYGAICEALAAAGFRAAYDEDEGPIFQNTGGGCIAIIGRVPAEADPVRDVRVIVLTDFSGDGYTWDLGIYTSVEHWGASTGTAGIDLRDAFAPLEMPYAELAAKIAAAVAESETREVPDEVAEAIAEEERERLEKARYAHGGADA